MDRLASVSSTASQAAVRRPASVLAIQTAEPPYPAGCGVGHERTGYVEAGDADDWSRPHALRSVCSRPECIQTTLELISADAGEPARYVNEGESQGHVVENDDDPLDPLDPAEDAENNADRDWHIGGTPEWDADPEGWEDRDDDYRADYAYEWERLRDR